MSKHWVIGRMEDILPVVNAVHDALHKTLKPRYPDMPESQMYDYLLFSMAVLGAALIQNEPDPKKKADEIGQALAENMKRLLK